YVFVGVGLVELVWRRAGEVRDRADLGRADVSLRTRIAIVARRLIRRGDPYAAPCPAGVARRALVAVVTGRPLGRLLPAARPHHTSALRAAVPRCASRAV